MGYSTMNTLIVLLGILATALAVPALFPHGKTAVYKYTVDVKAGTEQPAEFASQFGIDCHLHIKHDTSDPTLRNAYYVAMTDVKHGLYNGRVKYYQHLDTMQPIANEARSIQQPFMIVYDENGRLQGIKVMENESKWSMNIKKAIASTLQLDMINIQVQNTMPWHSFITQEDTIHGSCQVAYNVQPMHTEDPALANMFVVTKMHEPENCTHFSYYVHNHVEPEKCHIPEEKGMSSSSRRYFEIEKQDNAILIKKLIAQGLINYTPHVANADALYLLTNQTFVLENVAAESSVQLPSVNFQNIAIAHGFTFTAPQTQYAPEAGIDVTQGRHAVKLDEIVTKVKKMLSEAADYLKDNQIKMKPSDWKHGQTINRIMYTMNYMTVESYEQVYSELQDTTDSKQVTMKNIFLGIVPNVGTNAACLFTRNMIRRKMVSDQKAIMMLTSLSVHVRRPSHLLLLQMEALLHFTDPVSVEVRKASVLCFATLIHKTFMHEQGEVDNALLNRYLDHFMEHVKAEPTLEMKLTYVMAMNNVGLRNILKRLEPIVTGVVPMQDLTEVRLHAIWAIKHVIADLPNYAHNMLWPVLANVKNPVAIRIAAYDVLMYRFPHTARIMNMFWFMAYETDEHLYNYHVSNLKSMADSVEPCMMPVREMAKKLLRFTRTRHVPGPLSSNLLFNYIDEKFGYGEAVKTSLILDPLTGMPDTGSIEHFTSVARKISSKWGIHWNIKGLDEIVRNVKKDVLGKTVNTIKNENVKNMLSTAANDMPSSHEVNVNMMLTFNNRVVAMYHADQNNWRDMLNQLKEWKSLINKHLDNVNWEHVIYENHFKMHVPTDIGAPVVFFTAIPSLDSLRVHATVKEQANVLSLKLQMRYACWMHGEHGMAMYNPVADSWHSIRKTSAVDIVMPIDMTIDYNRDTNGVKIMLPRLPATEFSIGGVASSAKSYVTVTGDETNALKASCPLCRNHEVITNVMEQKTYENTLESKDTGLRLHMMVYDCENNVTPVLPMNELLQVFSSKNKNTMNNIIVHGIMAVRQQIINNMISSQDATCSNLIKVEPSIMYPTSSIEMTGKLNVQDFEGDKLNVFNGKRIDIRATMNAKAAATDESVRQWDVNLNVVLNQGHVNNTMKAMITRSGREEKNLKICIDGQKDYPAIDSDMLKITNTKRETNTKLKITMGETKEDKCVHDDLDLTILVKGELSEEQRKHMKNDRVNGTCVKHIQNPLLNPDGNHVPKTWECLYEATLHSTLRKYTMNIIARKSPVPSMVHFLQDVFSVVSWTQVDPKNMKITLEYPVLSTSLNVALVTPNQNYHLVQLPWGDPALNLAMDNVQFSSLALYRYLHSYTKMCAIYPQVVLTFDNGTIPFVLSDKWTLLTGDHEEQTFAVATRLTKNSKMDVKMFIGEHEIEITNTDAGTVVTVDKKVVNNYEKGIMVPENKPDSYVMKLTSDYKHLIVHSQMVPIRVSCTPYSVTVILDNELQGQVTGMCGHMDGTHRTTLPKIYSATNL